MDATLQALYVTEIGQHSDSSDDRSCDGTITTGE
jgi:hypothetical protein